MPQFWSRDGRSTAILAVRMGKMPMLRRPKLRHYRSVRLDSNQQNRGFKPQMFAVASRPKWWRKVEDLNSCGCYAVAGPRNRSLA
jgi:hypothetical protein